MGNGVGKLNLCFAGDAGEISRRRHHISVYLSDPLDDGLGHSFCYFPHDSSLLPSSTTTFKSISGASLSANTTTPLSTSLIDLSLYNTTSLDKASSFQSSDSFASIPLQPIPRNSIPSVRSSPIPPTSGAIPSSGPIERGFLSGPIERNFISGPLENQYDHLQRYKPNCKKWDLIRNLKKTIARVASGKVSDWTNGLDKNNENGTVNSGKNFNRQVSLVDDCDESFKSMNVQWAQGKAGEDRVHIVIPEEQGWVFVGIYDGFNGPDATDYLLNNLYSNVHQELNGLLCNDKSMNDEFDPSLMADHMFDKCLQCSETEDHPCRYGDSKLYCDSRTKRRKKSKQKWEERLELGNLSNLENVGINHSDILKALSVALRKTEESFLEIADTMLPENPELSLMGSCVLVMLMKGEDVYLMNVGDSRAVLAQKSEPDLASINEENLNDFEAFDSLPNLISLQLTMDHSTSVEEEVKRIKKEHHSDSSAISNDRVKGSLKVTRAFGAGFLKQPKWNNALLEMFRIDYVGSSPYITCSPSLYHHRLGPRDRFLILSSDGLYQYFTNEEAISEVEVFTSSFPEGDPAQHLVEEVLFRAAKKAGMDFHELLDIPQGDRRRYHDDVSIIIISFEGKIWRSSV
ncbi:hypothetical protein ACSBR2_003114 [Camellia fascicularis]